MDHLPMFTFQPSKDRRVLVLQIQAFANAFPHAGQRPVAQYSKGEPWITLDLSQRLGKQKIKRKNTSCLAVHGVSWKQ